MNRISLFVTAILAILIFQIGVTTSVTNAIAADKPDQVTLKDFPSIEGGMKSLASKLIYPASAKNDGVEGKVMVSATIGKDGSVDSIWVVKGVRTDLDSAAITVIKRLTWKPGKTEQGEAVKATVTIPIMFKLKSDKKNQ